MTEPMQKLLRILWMSNGVLMPSGYGTQTKTITPILKALGYPIWIAAYRGIEGGPRTNEDGILELPRVIDAHMNDVIGSYATLVNAELVWTLIDPFGLDPRAYSRFPSAMWTPIDCSPILPHERDQLAVCRYPIAMSKFGEAEMKAIGLKPFYVPHGVDSTVFTPVDRAKARKTLVEEITQQPIPENTFLIEIVAANGTGIPSRKNWSGMFETLALFFEKQPDARCYVHAESDGIWRGDPLKDMAEFYGIADKVYFPNNLLMAAGLIKPNVLNEIYNAGDVLLHLSRGEGFGIPLVEAQLTGMPIIVTDFSAMPELCFTGWTVGGRLYSFYPMTRQMIADEEEACACLCEAYDLWKAGLMPELREQTHQAALAYDAQKVVKDYLVPVLDQIHDDLYRKPPKPLDYSQPRKKWHERVGAMEKK